MKTSRCIVSTVLFSLLLLVVHYLHVSYFRVNVVFYAAISDVFIAAFLSAVLLFACDYFQLLGRLEKVQLVVIWLLAGYAFAITVPTVIDRSLSFYILEKIQQRGGGIRHERMADVFIKEYLPEHRLVDVRLTEQLESGTIVIEDGCVKLTKKGDLLASFGRFYRQHLLPKKRLLMGEYTDVLTDPFRNGVSPLPYECRR